VEKTLYIVRGVSGSGKTTLATTLARTLSEDAVAVAADDYFTDQEGNYNWVAEEIAKAHDYCYILVQRLMISGCSNIIIHNTCTREKDVKLYTEKAEFWGYKIVSLVVENRHGNKSVHGIPNHILAKQGNALKQNIKLI